MDVEKWTKNEGDHAMADFEHPTHLALEGNPAIEVVSKSNPSRTS